MELLGHASVNVKRGIILLPFLKPSQRCHACWTVHSKRLDERWHTCPCGASCHRDVNAALVLLLWGIQHVWSVLLAWLWLCSNRSQELTAYRGYRISS